MRRVVDRSNSAVVVALNLRQQSLLVWNAAQHTDAGGSHQRRRRRVDVFPAGQARHGDRCRYQPASVERHCACCQSLKWTDRVVVSSQQWLLRRSRLAVVGCRSTLHQHNPASAAESAASNTLHNRQSLTYWALRILKSLRRTFVDKNFNIDNSLLLFLLSLGPQTSRKPQVWKLMMTCNSCYYYCYYFYAYADKQPIIIIITIAIVIIN